MAAIDATLTPIYAQAYRLSGVIVAVSTGNPITGGLTTLAGQISKDGAAFSATGVTVTEIGTTGFFTVDINATGMTANTIILRVTSADAGAVYFTQFIQPAVLTEAAGQWMDATVKRLEQGTVNMSAFLLNYHTLSASVETVYARDSVTALFTGTLTGVASASSTQTRVKLA